MNIFSFFKNLFKDPFDRSVPLNTRVLRYLCKYGRGDASQICVCLAESMDEIKMTLYSLEEENLIRPCKKQHLCGVEVGLISYELY